MTVHFGEGARGCGSLLSHVFLVPKSSKVFTPKVMENDMKFMD